MDDWADWLDNLQADMVGDAILAYEIAQDEREDL